MPDIGLRELKARASEIVREVREQRKRYVITHRGRPVALLAPLEEPSPAASAERGADVWQELVCLGAEIGRGWRSSKSSSELLSQMRR